jgi:hypothetical protein
MRRNIKRSAVVGATVAGLFGAGVALAAWTNEGVGSGDVTAGQAKALTVSVGTVDGLVPNGTANVPFTVKNLNDYDVKLENATLQSVTTSNAGCNATAVTGDPVDLSSVAALAKDATSSQQMFPVTMDNTAANECQGAVFTVTLKVTGLSN